MQNYKTAGIREIKLNYYCLKIYEQLWLVQLFIDQMYAQFFSMHYQNNVHDQKM